MIDITPMHFRELADNARKDAAKALSATARDALISLAHGLDKFAAEAEIHFAAVQDGKLDEALKNTFPASDPPALTDPFHRVGRTDPDMK